jgi:2-polyprenyl-3-methyl-5-hydroxy-6-metoxy-1,4-benzoquinol methylase
MLGKVGVAYQFIPSFERYVFVLEFCQNKSVLDAGARNGFGSSIISHFSKSLTISDIKKHCLIEAKNYHKYYCPVEFVHVDFDKNFVDGTWEIIVAFEIIEHLSNPEFFLENLRKTLSKDGKFIFSVPHLTPAPEHKSLFDEQGIRGLVSKFFVIEEFYVQEETAIKKRKLEGVPTPKTYIGVAVKK